MNRKCMILPIPAESILSLLRKSYNLPEDASVVDAMYVISSDTWHIKVHSDTYPGTPPGLTYPYMDLVEVTKR